MIKNYPYFRQSPNVYILGQPARLTMKIKKISKNVFLAAMFCAALAPFAAFAQAKYTYVTAENGYFTPKSIIINTGDSVVWTNSGHDGHTVTADNGAFDSGPIAKDASFAQRFMNQGIFRYYCKVDGGPGGKGMSGVVIVLPK